jgi:TfoX/Sxy family transcriptional regulator of competence genes
MAYDEALADRVRAAIGGTANVTEIKMFGGLCFTVNGNMAVGITGDELMVRMSPEDGQAALTEPHARPMDFTGRPMRGFLYIGPEALATTRSLRRWVDRGVAYASSLPPKAGKRAR